jgi:general secretion pathway protein C
MADWNANLLPRLTAMGLDKRLPVLAMLMMTVILAYGLALATWELLPRQSQEALGVPVIASMPSDPAGKRQQANIARISQWHLFGKVQKVAPKPVTTMTDAPDTRLNLKLSGVLASSNPMGARAIIADSKGVEDAYAVNEKLPGNAILREIYADRVILEYRGRLETLRLPKDVPASMTSRASKQTAKTTRRPIRAAGNAGTSALLRQYRDALMTDPQSLMNLLSVSPVSDKRSGKLKGYRIRPGKDRKLLARFGLKSGDVVTGVNGISLDNPIKALEIMRDLSTASSVTLDVERNGVIESFVFQVE